MRLSRYLACRETVDRTQRSLGGRLLSLAVKAPLGVMQALLPSPLKSLTEPFRLPYSLGKGAVQLAKKSDEDEGIIATLKAFATVRATPTSDAEGVTLQAVVDQLQTQLASSDSLLRRSMADPQIRKRAPLLSLLSRKYGAALLTRFAERVDSSTGVNSRDSAFAAMRKSSSVADKIAFVSAKGARVASEIIKPIKQQE